MTNVPPRRDVATSTLQAGSYAAGRRNKGEQMEDRIETIARCCYTMNRVWCNINNDNSMPDWHNAPQARRDSHMSGVRFRLANPDAPPSAQHDEWLRSMAADGWVYGPEKNSDRKTHPCIVPYNELPPVQRAKDAIFIAVVRAMTE